MALALFPSGTGIEQGTTHWGELILPYPFFDEFPHYLVLTVLAKSEQAPLLGLGREFQIWWSQRLPAPERRKDGTYRGRLVSE